METATPSAQPTTFQILSDLHLEASPNRPTTFTFPATAPHLLLAGDISSLSPAHYPAYRAFLAAQTARYSTVFLVLGNHEFWHCASPAAALAAARQLERDPAMGGRLVLLHRRRFDVPGTRVSVLGCTLWSHIPTEAAGVVAGKVRDFGRIGAWSVEEHNKAHAADVAWLRGEVGRWRAEGGEDRSLVVVTHHAPTVRGSSAPGREGGLVGTAFATELLGEGWEGVGTWVFGHTHFSTEFERGGVRVVSNQRGYGGSGGSGFDVGKVIRV